MRALIDGRVLTDPNPGGVTRVSRALIKKILELDHIDQFTLLTSGLKKLSTSDFDTLSSNLHLRLPNKLIAAATYLNLTSIDRLTNKPFDALFLPNIEMVGVPKLPYAVLIHDLSFEIEPRWFSFKSRLWHIGTRPKTVIKHASALFTVSDHTKNDLITHFQVDPTRIQTLPLGHTPFKQQQTELPSGLIYKPYVLILGGNDPRKNVGCVLKAFQELKKDPRFIDTVCVVIGTKPTTLSTDRQTNLIYIPRPSDSLLSSLMRNARALLYPSWYEGFGLPLHEAHAQGIPLIASTSGALPETAPPGTIFVPPFKPHLWLQAMRSVLGSRPESPSTPTNDWTQAATIVIETLRRIAKR